MLSLSNCRRNDLNTHGNGRGQARKCAYMGVAYKFISLKRLTRKNMDRWLH